MNNIIKRTWNQNRMVSIEDLRGMAFQAEDGGHTFEISGINDAEEAVELSGTVAGVFMRPDGTDVALTGTASDGVVSVTLTDACYAVAGRFGLTIFVTADSKKVAVYAAVGTVSRTSGGAVAGDTPQDVVDLINAINAAVATIPAYYTDLMAAIAPTYSNTALYAVGSYAWYDGNLYRCISAITTAESWTAAHWTHVALGYDVADLKSAVEVYTGNKEISFISGKYVYNDTTKVYPNDIRTSSTGYKYAILECSAGDVFTVSGTSGMNNPIAWAFAASDGTILLKSKMGVTVTNAVVVAPANTAYLVINAKDTAKSYYGEMLVGVVGKLEDGQDYIFRYTDGVKFTDGDGTIDTGEGFAITDYVDVSSLESFFWRSNSASVVYLMTYDQNKSPLTGWYNASAVRELIVGSGVKYVRATFYKSASSPIILFTDSSVLFEYAPTIQEAYIDYEKWKRTGVYQDPVFAFESGKRIYNAAGLIKSESGYGVTDYIDVSGLDSFVWDVGYAGTSTDNNIYISTYNASKEYQASYYNSSEQRTINIASGVKYVRATFPLAYHKPIVNKVVDGVLYPLFINDSTQGSFAYLYHNANSVGTELVDIKASGINNESLEYPRIVCQMKSEQLTSMKWTPLADVPKQGGGTFPANEERTGLLYSDAIEKEKIVCEDVTLKTFMTALHNPYSLIYTENINENNSDSDYGVTYHGDANAWAYFGTACNHFVMRAVGCRVPYSSTDIVNGNTETPLFHKIYNQSATGLEIGDILAKSGHAMVVVDLGKDSRGIINSVTYAEAVGPGCTKTTQTASVFNTVTLGENHYEIFRYRELYKNIVYTPEQFAPIDGETPETYVYNDDICMFAGDYSCYCEGDLLYVNYTKGSYTQMEIYKNDVLLETITLSEDSSVHSINLTTKNYSYGKYKARLTDGSSNYSGYTYFQIVDATVTHSNGHVTVSSHNGTPVWASLCALNGYCWRKHEVTAEEATAGEFNIFINGATSSYNYVKVVFECDYGRVMKRISK